jgi:hypothetical protein
MAASLVLLMAGCGGRSTSSGPQREEPTKPLAANTGKLTLHFKDWT